MSYGTFIWSSRSFLRLKKLPLRWIVATALAGTGLVSAAQRTTTLEPPQYGPFNGVFLPDGSGLRMKFSNPLDSVLFPSSAWTLSCWVDSGEPVIGTEFVAGVGDLTAEYSRFLVIGPAEISLWAGQGNSVRAPYLLRSGEWHLIAATFDGELFHLFADGKELASGHLALGTPAPVVQMAPPALIAAQQAHFGGRIASLQLLRRALSASDIKMLQQSVPDFTLLNFEEGSKPWPVQTHAQAGYLTPQDSYLLPVSKALPGKPVAVKRPPMSDSLALGAKGEWSLGNNWMLREAPAVNASGAQVSSPQFAAKGWMRATVPGTVLTTLIDDGIYPDPDFGLNNLAIPESLNKQDYWYRNQFEIPSSAAAELKDASSRISLNFYGINYKAEIWLNGILIGHIRGAFRRGTFDVTSLIKPNQKNVVAVRISPPPHPGIPQEQSILGGPGENGGSMELDGPTFLATEGWDWIPAIRDRDSGIWQPVTLTTSRTLKIGDARVVSAFNHHDISATDLDIEVPITNSSASALEATLRASVETISVNKALLIPPGETVIHLTPAEFPQLHILHPRLWWPNGYGKPEMYPLGLQLLAAGIVSDSRQLRFGVREVSYELSLLDKDGHLRRVEYTPAADRHSAEPIVEVSHNGMREIPSADAEALGIAEDKRDDYQYHTVVSSLAPGAERSPSIQLLQAKGSAPYLTLKVNGVRIAARGGNWGMDDSRKRVSRSHLEPFFRLNRDANMNIIRNWVGQSTEETFFELADEYGMMVWNDFWESTQNYNLEAEDPALFLDNARDTILQFRNHPSIVLWCGRNEGVPQPIINAGLDELTRTLDGTRFYSPSSNQINLQQSGPYSYQNPALYFTTINKGFSVETGTPSMSTLESFESTTPKEDQWPIDDVWAYHDWHESGNGRVEPFMAEIEAEFGAATSLPDFERKAQMLNFVDHRAIFEGMNANLWAPNSGRMLWMTQPAWPSTMWQILSSDYDTQASFYGAKTGAEPIHIQLNLSTFEVDAINTTTEPRNGLTITAGVYLLSGAKLLDRNEAVSVAADDATHSFKLDLAPLLAHSMVLVELQLHDDAGKVLSRNVYWLGNKSSSYRELNTLAPASMQVTAFGSQSGGEAVIVATIKNVGKVPALATKLTLLGTDQKRILPAYLSDNYISLLAGESERVEIRFPTQRSTGQVDIALRGWNAEPSTTRINVP